MNDASYFKNLTGIQLRDWYNSFETTNASFLSNLNSSLETEALSGKSNYSFTYSGNDLTFLKDLSKYLRIKSFSTEYYQKYPNTEYTFVISWEK